MAGDVAVLLILPESNGVVDRSTEDWTPTTIEAVRHRVQAALDWWRIQLPLAQLRFHVRLEVVPTDYEPTNHGLAQEGLWIGDTLRRLGYTGTNYFDQAYAAAYSVRDQFAADWGTVLFVPNSERGNGYLSDGYFAYAYINGPHLVVTLDAGGYGQNHMAAVLAHELGHTFGALDQYAAARVPCDRVAGYLSAPTTNSQYGGCGTRLTSIMDNAVAGFNGGQADPSALHQVGYRDSDGDGLIDPLDTAPAVELSPNSLASATSRPILHGTTSDIAFPSSSQPAVSLQSIRTVEYRVDGGPWLPTSPADGAFDSADEAFSAELPLYDGRYLLEVRAVNSAGQPSPTVSRTLEITWVGPAPNYTATAPKASSSLELALQFEAPATTAAVQVAETPDFTGATWHPYAAALGHTLNAGDGWRTLFVRFRDQFGLESLPLPVVLLLDTTPPDGIASRSSTASTQLLLSAEDAGSAVVDVEVTIGDAAPSWMPYATRVELTENAKGQAVQVRFRDALGNTSRAIVAVAEQRVYLPLIVR
jgi:hypothetical protein